MELDYTPISLALPVLRDGWLLQYRGKGYLSELIQHATGGPHSHSAMIRVRNGGKFARTVDVLEVREFIGGRAIPISGQVETFSGQLDVFKFDSSRWPGFLPTAATEYMRMLTRFRYGWRAVIDCSLRMVPGLWRFWPIETSDVEQSAVGAQPFCSQAVAMAYQAGGVDVVPRCPNYLVTPNDLTRSLAFEYLFTLVSDTDPRGDEKRRIVERMKAAGGEQAGRKAA